MQTTLRPLDIAIHSKTGYLVCSAIHSVKADIGYDVYWGIDDVIEPIINIAVRSAITKYLNKLK